MDEPYIDPEDLLAGAAVAFDVRIPDHLFRPGPVNGVEDKSRETMVQLSPLTIGTYQLIMKAARNDPGLIPLLMIRESVVQPRFSLEQVKQMHLGLVNFLIAHIRVISGLTEKKTPLTS